MENGRGGIKKNFHQKQCEDFTSLLKPLLRTFFFETIHFPRLLLLLLFTLNLRMGAWQEIMEHRRPGYFFTVSPSGYKQAEHCQKNRS